MRAVNLKGAVTVTVLIVKDAPLAVKTMLCGELVVFTETFPKFTLVALCVNPVVPVPDKLIVSGELLALLTTDTLSPLTAPAAVGAKATSKVTPCVVVTVAGRVGSEDATKGAGTVMAETETEPPLAESVMVCVALLVSTATLPKLRLETFADNVITVATC